MPTGTKNTYVGILLRQELTENFRNFLKKYEVWLPV